MIMNSLAIFNAVCLMCLIVMIFFNIESTLFYLVYMFVALCNFIYFIVVPIIKGSKIGN